MTLAMTLGRGGLGLPRWTNQQKEACGAGGPISKDPWTRALGSPGPDIQARGPGAEELRVLLHTRFYSIDSFLYS